jgi:hypothetical protein
VALWNFNETRNLIQEVFGADQLGLANPSIDSVAERLYYARYHYQEVKSLLGTHMSKAKASGHQLLAILPTSNEGEHEKQLFFVRVGAQLTACVQSVHAQLDILANATYYALGCNLQSNAIQERSVSLAKVQKHLSADHRYVEIGQLFLTHMSHDDNVYLTALANYSKHRSVVKPSLWIAFTDIEPDGYKLNFRGFSHNKDNYAERSALAFLESEFSRISKCTIAVGNEINLALRRQLKP